MNKTMFPQQDLREETAPLRARNLDQRSQLPWDGVSQPQPITGLSL